MRWTAAGLVAVLAGLSTGCATAQDPGALAQRVSAQSTRQVLAQHRAGLGLLGSDHCSSGWYVGDMDARGRVCRPALRQYHSHEYIVEHVREAQRLNNAKF